MSDWLLILGAGASAPAPSNIPTFVPLSRAILNELGWDEVKAVPATRATIGSEDTQPTWARRDHPAFPTIAPRRLPPEVVFGTLHRYGVRFAKDLRKQFAEREPNAVHVIAANLLAAGGAVWTTNVDRLVEDAYVSLAVGGWASEPDRYFREAVGTASASSHGSLDRPTLVKFHGTIDVERSLAFADLQLLTPLRNDVVDKLVAIACGRRIVVYGYAGQDLDLQSGLRKAMAAGVDVRWFEPDVGRRDDIRTTFGPMVRFVPESFIDRGRTRAETGEAFLAAAAEALLTDGLTDELHGLLMGVRQGNTTPGVTFSFGFRGPPAIVHARLVERFGDHQAEGEALHLARREDARRLRLGAIPGHVRWALSYSLYHGGPVARMIRSYLARPRLLRVPLTGWIRNRALDKGTALMLADGDWAGLDWVTGLAFRTRSTAVGEPRPNDRYYRAHALRYQFRVSEAREQAAAAEAGLEGSTDDRVDAERLAGAILEQGILDLYQGRFEDALARGRDLHSGRGQYAIRRWPAWGHWLDGFAHAYRGDVQASREAFDEARNYFVSEPLIRAAIDCDAGERFLQRVELSLNGGEPLSELPSDWGVMSPRQHDDARLILADHRLAAGDVSGAKQELEAVLMHPSNDAARWNAELGMAEVRRRLGEPAPGFEALRELARTVGARLLEIQSLLGLHRCGAMTAEEVRVEVAVPPLQLGPSLTIEQLLSADPPILWLVT